jgi:hypothetical protein
VFFGPLAFRSLCLFRGSSSLWKKRSSTTKGLLLGASFSAEGPQDEGIVRNKDSAVKLQHACARCRRVRASAKDGHEGYT